MGRSRWERKMFYGLRIEEEKYGTFHRLLNLFHQFFGSLWIINEIFVYRLMSKAICTWEIYVKNWFVTDVLSKSRKLSIVAALKVCPYHNWKLSVIFRFRLLFSILFPFAERSGRCETEFFFMKCLLGDFKGPVIMSK